jgi:subtilisin-like proprotein convertase family protein
MAAAADGSACGVGAAFNARLAGLRLPLNNRQTDAQEAAALTHALDHIDIYNSSWGPPDSGTSADMQAPGPLTRAALRRGVTQGRGGLGAIYVWAAGNGRANHDNVNADGYASSIYTVAVAATDNAGRAAWYSEPGAPILVNAPSSGPAGGGVRTTAPGSAGCTDEFGGTSSAAPLVAGVVALMLEANPALTWRDVQHILVRTAERNDPAHPDWTPNGAGLWVNHDYGFGRVNAAAAVALARNWATVNPAYTLTAPKRAVSAAIPARAPLSTTVRVADSFPVEHVEVIVNIQHPSRGQLDIALISPSGTVSTLMAGRARDHGANYRNWRLMSVRHWGEDAAGTWTLRVTDREGDDLSGSLKDWTLVIHGSKPPVSGEIARNNGFERARADGLPAIWKAQGKRAPADRVRVDHAVPRTIAFDGARSLQLKGTRDKNLRLLQTLPTRGLTTGDTLMLSAMIQARDLSTGLELRLLVTYADPALGTQMLAIPAASGSYPYTLIHDKLTLAGPVQSAQLAISFQTARGRGTALLDDVSVVVAKAVNAQPAGGLVALPVAPGVSDALRGH